MRARLVLRDKKVYPDGLIVERVVYILPQAITERPHGFKYRLYCGYPGRCLARYDNELGKGDHVHYGDEEHAYRFVSLERLVMNRHVNEAACPRSPQVSSLDQRAVLPRRMTAAHPHKEPALQGPLSIECFERR